MNFFTKVLLSPFPLIYGGITSLRNHLFDIGYKRSFIFEIPVISVGNLSVGGSGKTPTVEYLIRMLKDRYRLATLSRGYGRRTRGFRLASNEDDFRTIGDEPFQYFYKFGEEVSVAVGEERALAIPEILYHKEETEVILLDDAYQHRTVLPSVNILLTDYNRPFFSDSVLPVGRLRESRKGAKRADIVLVTKCPHTIDEGVMEKIIISIRKYSKTEVPVFFTRVSYGRPTSIHNHQPQDIGKEVKAFSGIANNHLFKSYLEDTFTLTQFRAFRDHHEYSISEIRKLGETAREMPLLTTEKDMVKLLHPDFIEVLKNAKIFYIPIVHEFIKNGTQFDDLIINSIKHK